MEKRWLFCSLLLICCRSGAQTQQTIPAGSSAQGPELRLAVQVADKSGNAVTTLKQSDFTVVDNGHPVPIESFSANESGVAEPGSESVILVIDAINVYVNLLTQERTQIATFLRSNQGHLPAPVSIVAVNENDLVWISQPSADGNTLAAQLHQWQPHMQPRPIMSDQDFQERWQESVAAFDRIMRHEAGAPGRKLMIWISPGWPFINASDIQATDSLMHQWMNLIVATSTNLRRSQVTMEVVEPQGSEYVDWSNIWHTKLKPVKKWDHAEPSDVTLQVLASQSGGQVVHSSSDIAALLAKCMSDAISWYTLAIAEQPDKPDTWHDLQVRVAQPGILVRSINGYYAQPQP